MKRIIKRTLAVLLVSSLYFLAVVELKEGMGWHALWILPLIAVGTLAIAVAFTALVMCLWD